MIPTRPPGARADICLCLAGPTVQANLDLLARHGSRAEMAELRADYLDPGEVAAATAMPSRAGVPLILTLRRPAEGGRFPGSERDRIALLERLASGGFALVDLEEDLDAPNLVAR
ncbi:MAG TPA: type I 3-dehydroquinate dehydratase, partial [Spirochaetia bacterium]|nr:type I 3-dehydroquinate dehydratase [Spirochaetia bacterium]